MQAINWNTFIIRSIREICNFRINRKPVSVLCSPRKRGPHKRSGILTGITKSQFSHIHSSVMSYQNGNKINRGVDPHAGKTTFQIWIRSFKPFLRYRLANFHKFFGFFFVFFLSFYTLGKNCYNSRMCALIWLKFVASIGGLKAILYQNQFGGKSDQHSHHCIIKYFTFQVCREVIENARTENRFQIFHSIVALWLIMSCRLEKF